MTTTIRWTLIQSSKYIYILYRRNIIDNFVYNISHIILYVYIIIQINQFVMQCNICTIYNTIHNMQCIYIILFLFTGKVTPAHPLSTGKRRVVLVFFKKYEVENVKNLLECEGEVYRKR